MKKLIFFLPAIGFSILTLCLCLISRQLLPLWQIFNILLWLSGWLMAKGKAWGAAPGLLPGAMILWLKGSQGLRVEVIVALGWTVYYLACGLWTWKTVRKKK